MFLAAFPNATISAWRCSRRSQTPPCRCPRPCAYARTQTVTSQQQHSPHSLRDLAGHPSRQLRMPWPRTCKPHSSHSRRLRAPRTPHKQAADAFAGGAEAALPKWPTGTVPAIARLGRTTSCPGLRNPPSSGNSWTPLTSRRTRPHIAEHPAVSAPGRAAGFHACPEAIAHSVRKRQRITRVRSEHVSRTARPGRPGRPGHVARTAWKSGVAVRAVRAVRAGCFVANAAIPPLFVLRGWGGGLDG